MMWLKELKDCIALCEDRTVVTFEDEKFTNTTRELIMELLSVNVSTSCEQSKLLYIVENG